MIAINCRALRVWQGPARAAGWARRRCGRGGPARRRCCGRWAGAGCALALAGARAGARRRWRARGVAVPCAACACACCAADYDDEDARSGTRVVAPQRTAALKEAALAAKALALAKVGRCAGRGGRRGRGRGRGAGVAVAARAEGPPGRQHSGSAHAHTTRCCSCTTTQWTTLTSCRTPTSDYENPMYKALEACTIGSSTRTHSVDSSLQAPLYVSLHNYSRVPTTIQISRHGSGHVIVHLTSNPSYF
ncbi:Protein of unknown function [Gryllus bimaculatus]|nr:Protein of unknown function [Gryllus bimaculatus]